jgi:hypothetical protein
MHESLQVFEKLQALPYMYNNKTLIKNDKMKAIMILVTETTLILVAPPYSSSCDFCEFIHYYNLWFLKLSKLTIFSTFIDEHLHFY